MEQSEAKDLLASELNSGLVILSEAAWGPAFACERGVSGAKDLLSPPEYRAFLRKP